MAYVSTVSGSRSGSSFGFSTSVSNGDVLIAFVFAPKLVASGPVSAERMSVPTGWHRLGLWSGSYAGTHEVMLFAAWTRATSTGTLSGSFVWDGSVQDGSGSSAVRVTRWSGMTAVRGVASVSNSYPWRYPAVADPTPSSAGHAIRVALRGPYYDDTQPSSQFVPSGHTMRTEHTTEWNQSPGFTTKLVVSDQSISSVAPAATWLMVGKFGTGITIYLASTIGPQAPVITYPDVPQANLAEAWTLSWIPDGVQTGVRVTRQSLDAQGAPTGSVQYLTSVTSPAWSTSPTTVTTTATSVDFAAGAWASAGARYRITVATRGDSTRPDLGAAAVHDIESWQAPTASNPSVGGSLVGGVIVNRAPWVTVDGTPGSGASIDLHEVQVVDSTTGDVYAGGTYYPGWWYAVPATEEGALPNGVTVLLRGRVRQQGAHWSEWVEAGPYPVDAPRPATPVATVASVTHPVSGLPGLGVEVSSIAGDVTLYRNGIKLGVFPSSGTVTINDYLPPSDVEVTYTVTVTDGGAPPETSLHSPPATATLTTGGEREHCWLIDPLDFSAAVQAHCVDLTEAIGHPGHVARPLQASAPVAAIVQSLPHHTPTGDLTVEVHTPDQLAAVKALFTAGRPIMYRRWREKQPHSTTEHPLQPLRFVPFGDVAVERPASGPSSWRHVSVQWVEQ